MKRKIVSRYRGGKLCDLECGHTQITPGKPLVGNMTTCKDCTDLASGVMPWQERGGFRETWENGQLCRRKI